MDVCLQCFNFTCNHIILLSYAVDNLMHYCTRPKAECNSALGRPRYREVIV